MKLKPRLDNGTMLLSFGMAGLEIARREITADVWKKVGLAIHKENDGWRISHVDSGKAILRNMKDRETAISYMMKVRGILPSWNFSASHFTERKDKKDIVMVLRTLQKEIDDEKLQKRKR